MAPPKRLRNVEEVDEGPYLLLTIGSTGSVRWSWVIAPAVPEGHIQPGEMAFVSKPIHAESRRRGAIHPSAIAPEDIEEIDRSARSYGWEIGHGHPLTERIEATSPDNPFRDANWRERVGKGE